MPSLPYLTDTSIQLTGTYTTSTATLDNYTTSNYVSNVSNLLINNINTKQNILTASTNLLGVGSAISALDYDKITLNKPIIYTQLQTNTLLNTKEAILSFTAPLTRSTNTIGINLSSYYTSTQTNNLLNAKQPTLTAATILLGVGSNISSLDYNKITLNKPTNFQSDWNSTIINKPTNFQSDWNSTIINKPIIYTQTETNNLLATKQATLTAATTLLGVGSNISSLDYNKITLNKPTNFQSDWNSTIINKPVIYTQTETNNLLATKQATLTAATTLLGIGGSITGINYNTVINKPTYTSPISSNLTTNNISIDLTSYSTTGNDPNFLKLNGTTKMTGGLNFNNLVQNKVISLFDATPANNFQFVGLGANLGLILSLFSISDAFKFQVGTSTTTSSEVMRINGNGNVGIGTNNPQYLLELYNSVGNTNTPFIKLGGGGGANNQVGIIFNPWAGRSGLVASKIYAIDDGGASAHLCFATAATGQTTEAVERMRITTNGNVNIGELANFSVNTKLHIKGGSSGYSQPLVRIEQTTAWDGNYCLQTVGYTDLGGIRINGGEANSIYKTALTGDMGLTVNNGNMLFNVNGAERMRISSDGNVGIANPTPIGTLSIGRPDATSDGTLTISKNSGGNRNFKMGYDSSFNFCIGDFGNSTIIANNAWASTQLTINYGSGNVGIGISNQSQKLYVNGTSTINGSLAVNGDLTVQDGSSIRFGSGGADGRIYRAGGQVFIEADDLIYFRSTTSGGNCYCNQGTFFAPAAINTDGTLYAASTATIGGLLRHRQSFNYGETLAYTVGYNGGNQSGWFWTTNGFWDGFATTSYLTIAVYCPGLSVWFGRAYLGAGGGFYNVVADYVNPTGSTLNALQVVDYWGPYGANSLRIITTNGAYGGSMIIKISG